MAASCCISQPAPCTPVIGITEFPKDRSCSFRGRGQVVARHRASIHGIRWGRFGKTARQSDRSSCCGCWSTKFAIAVNRSPPVQSPRLLGPTDESFCTLPRPASTPEIGITASRKARFCDLDSRRRLLACFRASCSPMRRSILLRSFGHAKDSRICTKRH